MRAIATPPGEPTLRRPLTPEERAKKDLDDAAFIKDRDANAYKGLRRLAYPSIEDQLDIIYHFGLEAWKVKIKETKDLYPKPE